MTTKWLSLLWVQKWVDWVANSRGVDLPLSEDTMHNLVYSTLQHVTIQIQNISIDYWSPIWFGLALIESLSFLIQYDTNQINWSFTCFPAELSM